VNRIQIKENKMAKIIKASDKQIILTAVRHYRRKLLRDALHNGKGTIRVFGSAGKWQIGIDNGSKVVRLNGKLFEKMGQGIAFVFSKYKIKATQFKGKIAA